MKFVKIKLLTQPEEKISIRALMTVMQKDVMKTHIELTLMNSIIPNRNYSLQTSQAMEKVRKRIFS